ncbi:LNS2-domain-containing protein [Acaromyces ingoldii]|uniref:phosphatidate phosphatase n=1 Tax=Acaromyces ingoldii TaxID=215250 RepID=A0A316YMS7_9BASI|nr:LNS2-domain-containing protein [Acaromyces ingoldii]PWN90511.1 LNS2-domain-containing protein [Acaromyces ingoldii]
MQYVGRLVSSVYNTITPSINPATLSGAIDVIVVERQVERDEDDGEGGTRKVQATELASTPFHVRFGKMSVLRPAERKVTLHLNNSPDPLPFAMKVGEAGEAFFVLELDDDEQRQGIPDDLVTSPILSATTSPAIEPSDEPQEGDGDLIPVSAPRKFIEEDYVPPLDLGGAASSSAHSSSSSSQQHQHKQSNASARAGTDTVSLSESDMDARSAQTRYSVDTAVTSPSLRSQSPSKNDTSSDAAAAAAAAASQSDSQTPAPPPTSGSHSHPHESGHSGSGPAAGPSSILDSMGAAASKASGAIGAAGRSVVPSSLGRTQKLDKLAEREQKQGWGNDTSVAGAKVAQGDRTASQSPVDAHQYEPERAAEGQMRMQQQEDDHPPDDAEEHPPDNETERLEVEMRDRAENTIETVEKLEEIKSRSRERKGSQSSSSVASSSRRKSSIIADRIEEAYPAPFGSTSTGANSETRPTTQPEHAEFLGGRKLMPVESGIEGKGTVMPAQVDARTVRGRLEHLDINNDDSGLPDEDKHVGDEEVAAKGGRKEDLQYMLDMDGYKMTADGEDLAFAEGNRFSDELPLSRRHGGNGSNGHHEILNDGHHHHFDRGHEGLPRRDSSMRRSSHGDARSLHSNDDAEQGHLKEEAGVGGPAGSSPMARRRTVDSNRSGTLLDPAAILGEADSAMHRDELDLSRDLVRLARSLRSDHTPASTVSTPGVGGPPTGKRSSARSRRHFQDVSLSDTEAELPDTQETRGHQRATSDDTEFGRYDGDQEGQTSLMVRDDAALGMSDEMGWRWGSASRRISSVGAPASATRTSISSESSTGELKCDDDDAYKFHLILQDARHTFELSLCDVGLEEGQTIEDYHFEENKVSYQRFIDDADVVNDERLVVRYHERFLTWENASAVLATLSLYRKAMDEPMSKDGSVDPAVAADGVGGEGHRESVWRRWWNRSGREAGDLEKAPPPRLMDRSQTDSVLTTEKPRGEKGSEEGPYLQKAATAAAKGSQKMYAKTLRLTSDQLKSLNLRKGANTITFSVTSSYSGVATCTARIFLWESSHHIVVSDIDGTITKSDALGHVFTMIGRDWTHMGVAKLYTDIARNGYRIMYLTSRAIGQADTTRDYLRGIKQGNYQMPDGPVIMSPDRLMASLHREVILRKPEVFKMACLRDIARLFGADPRTAQPQPGSEWPGVQKGSIEAANGPGAGRDKSPADGAATQQAHQAPATPFYAGFGNRITDALSYRSVNVPSSRIFTIDSNGEVKMELLELAGYKSSYIHMTDLVDQMFPPITIRSSKGTAGKPEFNDFNFWRPSISTDFELPPDEELAPTPPQPASPALSARSGRSIRSAKSNASLKSASTEPVLTTTASSNEEGGETARTSRLSRFGLGSLGLSRRSSAQTIAVPETSQQQPQSQQQQQQQQHGQPNQHHQQPTHAKTMPPSSSTPDLLQNEESGNRQGGAGNYSRPSSPGGASSPSSSYGSGVTSWAAGWRRRAASPGANSDSSVRATSPLVGPVITAEPDSDDGEGEGEDDDDVSSFGDENEGRQEENMGDDVLEEDEDDDDPLLATGEIRFEWRG